jgi:diguanylate cyclase (GGDEF)-like protein
MKQTVVLLNDVSNNLQNLTKHLKTLEDMELVIIQSREEFDRVLEEKTVHLIIASSQCKQLNPIEICKKIRSEVKIRFLPFLYINKKDEKADTKEAYEAGVTECIDTPFSLEDITLRMRSHSVSYHALKKCLTQNERLALIVATDSLTKVSNRMHLQTIISQSIKEFKRYDRMFSLVYFQVEDIQKFNLLYGFAKGDKLLKNIAQTIKHLLRDSDIIARWSGSDFIIFMPKSTIDNAGALVKKLNTLILKEEFATKYNIRLKYGATQVKKEDTMYTIVERSNKALLYSIENNIIYTHFL